MSRTIRNNIVTVEYNINSVAKKKEYKEMRDRVKAATGLDNKDVAHIFGPAYGEFYEWLEKRHNALRAYEDTIVKQVLDVLNNPGSPYRELREAANEAAGYVPEDEDAEDEDTDPAHERVTRILNNLAKYKDDHDIDNKGLARMVGVSETTIYQWLQGRFRPAEANANRLESWLASQGYPI